MASISHLIAQEGVWRDDSPSTKFVLGHADDGGGDARQEVRRDVADPAVGQQVCPTLRDGTRGGQGVELRRGKRRRNDGGSLPARS